MIVKILGLLLGMHSSHATLRPAVLVFYLEHSGVLEEAAVVAHHVGVSSGAVGGVVNGFVV